MLEMIPEGHPLEGVRLKLARAEHHLETLHREITDFFGREPYSISYERKPDAGEHIYRVHVSETPPLALSVIIGDCLQNMRSALDHLVWQLALRSGKRTTPSRLTAFPVCDTRETFRAKGTKNKVADLTAEDRAGIEKLQPFQVGGAARKHWLWHLNELARIDRHRILHVVGGANESIGMKVGERDEDGNFRMIPIRFFTLDMKMVSLASFKDGAEVARFGVYPDPAQTSVDVTEVKMECDFSYRVTFSQDTGIPTAYTVIDVLGNILAHIETEVVPPFVDSFGIMA
jgi:hypothetical protein